MDKFGMHAPKFLVGVAGHVLFWPIAVSQYSMYRLGYLDWYSLVFPFPSNIPLVQDPDVKQMYPGRVLLGALPWPAATRAHLLRKEKVSAVLNLVSEKKIEFPQIEKRMDLPLTDFLHPSFQEIQPAVEFLDACVKEGRTVYVHCRAGKGRSATVVMCWLVSRFHLSPEAAQTYLSRVRPQILSTLKDRQVVGEFAKLGQ